MIQQAPLNLFDIGMLLLACLSISAPSNGFICDFSRDELRNVRQATPH
jgi:hypothetical protein